MTSLKSCLPRLILLLGALLRIATLVAAALWFDEAVTLYRTGIPFMQLFTSQTEASGDLFLELLLRLVMWIDPHSLWLLRLPSLLAGLLSLWLVWKLMQEFQFNLQQQCLVALFAAFLPGLIWLGQDARAYGLLACLFLAAIWFATQDGWLGLTACCGLMIYCHSIGPVFALAALAIAWKLHFWQVRKMLVCGLVTGLAWIPAIIRILGNGGALDYAWGNKSTLEIWVVSSFASAWTKVPLVEFFAGAALMLATLYLLTRPIKLPARTALIMAWSIPLAGMMAFSLYRNVIIYRTLMPLLFPFVFWLGWELGAMQKPIWLRYALAAAWLILLMDGLLVYRPADRGGELDQVAAQIRSQWRIGDQLVYATMTVGLPMEYYLGDLPHAWLTIVHDPLLTAAGIPRTTQGCPGGCKRWWVIIPDEQYLISPEECSRLKAYMPGQPVLSVYYMQAARINVYLEDAK
jgi:hypothetical protein